MSHCSFAKSGLTRTGPFVGISLTDKEFDQLAPWSWKGLFAPSGTPKPVLDKLQTSLAKLLTSPEFQTQIESNSPTEAVVADGGVLTQDVT